MKSKVKKQKNKFRKFEGITLISLVIAIILLIILAGIVINIAIGENGIIIRAKKARNSYNESTIKEKLELAIIDLQTDLQGKSPSIDELEKMLNNLGGVSTSKTNEIIQGEYENYEIIIDKNGKVTIGGKLANAKPTGKVKVIVNGEEIEESEILPADDMQIKVIGEAKEGKIVEITALNGAELLEDKGTTEKIFKVNENKEYTFIIKGDNGRSCIISYKVNNIIEMVPDIYTAIKNINQSGEKTVKVQGRTSDGIETIEKYSLNVIRHVGDLVLDGNEENNIKGATYVKETKTYEFGDISKDVSTGQYAKNTVVLKVEGNLTIQEDITLSSVRNENYGGPKGMVIYCTGTLENNGNISMTQRGAKAEGQNVYLFKNEDNSFEYIPAIGGAGGSAVTYGKSGTWNWGKSNAGQDGINRQTGGGSSGSVGASGYSGGSNYSGYGEARSGAGTYGTSYSGGTGGGGAAAQAGKAYATDGQPNGGTGGMPATYNVNDARYQGAGNPKGGTGGTIVIFTELATGNGNVSSNGSTWGNGTEGGGSSGAGSINIFITSNQNKLTWKCTSDGYQNGLIAKGGNGSISIGSLNTGSYIEY